jgi:hypothetical protein
VGLALMLAGDRMAWRRGVFHGAIMDGCEHDAWSRCRPMTMVIYDSSITLSITRNPPCPTLHPS